MGNLIEVYSKNNLPQNNQRICFFVFCFLQLLNVAHITKEVHIYLLIQLLIETNPKENSPLRLRLSIARVKVKVGVNRINFSKNAKLTNIVTKAYKMKNFVLFALQIILKHFPKKKKKKNSSDKTVGYFC